MLNKISRMAIVIALLASGLLSFLSMRSFEQFSYGLDWDYLVYVDGTAPNLTDDEFSDAVASVAEDEEVTLTHLVLDTENPLEGGTLFQTVGPDDPHDWVDEGRYPAFTRNLHLRVRPVDDLGSARRSGYYFVSGADATSSSVAARLRDLGVKADVIPIDRAGTLRGKATESPTDTFTWLAAFLVVALTVAGSFLRARPVGVLDLHGRSTAEILLRDLGDGIRTLALGAGGYLVGVVPLLLWYNHLHWFGTFLGTQAMFLGLMLAGLAAFHVLGLVLVRRMDVLARVKGELRSRGVHLLVYGARLAAFAMALGTIALLVDQEALVRAKADSAAVWESTRGNVQLGLRAMPTPGQQTGAERALGSWLEQEERSGDVILLRREPVEAADPRGELGAAPRTELLTVNSTYLRTREVLDTSGAAVTPDDSSDVLALVPADSPVTVEELTEFVRRQVDAELFLQARDHGLSRQAAQASGREYDVRVVRTRPGQQLFTYLTTVSGDQNPFVRDPLVVVLPSARPVFAREQWAAAMSSGQVILRDKDRALESLRADNLLDYVASVDEVEVTNAAQARQVQVTANLYRLNVLAVLAALAATAIGFTLVHTRRHRSAMFAQHIHGWSFLRRHHLLLVLDTALVVALAARWAWTSQQIDPSLPLNLQHEPPPTWVAWAVAAATLALLWLGLVTLSRSALRHRAAD